MRYNALAKAKAAIQKIYCLMNCLTICLIAGKYSNLFKRIHLTRAHKKNVHLQPYG